MIRGDIEILGNASQNFIQCIPFACIVTSLIWLLPQAFRLRGGYSLKGKDIAFKKISHSALPNHLVGCVVQQCLTTLQ